MPKAVQANGIYDTFPRTPRYESAATHALAVNATEMTVSFHWNAFADPAATMGNHPGCDA
jgi:hypothetical protein